MKNIDQTSINTIRVLAAETINKANSGHPGLPLGAAPMAYTLFSKHYLNNPSDLKWDNREVASTSYSYSTLPNQNSTSYTMRPSSKSKSILVTVAWLASIPAWDKAADTAASEPI